MKLILFIYLFSASSIYSTSYYCDHPQTCSLIKNEIDKDSDTVENLFNIKGDPHHYRPSINEIKKAKSKSNLFLSPSELNSWSKKLQLKEVFKLSINKNLLNEHKGNSDQFAHFWLYPKVKCDITNQIKKILNRQPLSCSNILETITSNKKIVISHSALSPILNKNNIEFYTITGSGHHNETSSQNLKAIINLLKKEKSIIWILEEGINIPTKINKMIRKEDRIIKVNHLNPSLSSFEYIKKKIEEIL